MNYKLYAPIFTLLLFAKMSYGQKNQDRQIIYDRNVVYITPYIATEEGKGVDIGYERFLGKRGLFSISLPVYVVWNKSSYLLDSLSNYGKQSYTVSDNSPYYYLSPGFRYYPAGCKHSVRYAIGTSLVIANGTTIASEDNQLTYGFGVTEGQRYKRSI